MVNRIREKVINTKSTMNKIMSRRSRRKRRKTDNMSQEIN